MTDLHQVARERVYKAARDFFGEEADRWLEGRNFLFHPTPLEWMTDRSRWLRVADFIEKLLRNRAKLQRRADRRAIQALGRYTETEMQIMELEEDMEEHWEDYGTA